VNPLSLSFHHHVERGGNSWRMQREEEKKEKKGRGGKATVLSTSWRPGLQGRCFSITSKRERGGGGGGNPTNHPTLINPMRRQVPLFTEKEKRGEGKRGGPPHITFSYQKRSLGSGHPLSGSRWGGGKGGGGGGGGKELSYPILYPIHIKNQSLKKKKCLFADGGQGGRKEKKKGGKKRSNRTIFLFSQQTIR